MTLSSLWPDVDTTDLRLLVEVSRQGSIRAAAIGLKMSQPSASARLSALERRLGAPLLDRSTRGATLTLAGQAVSARALRMLDLLAAAKNDALHLSGQRRLSLGAPASFAPGLAVLVTQIRIPATTITWRSDHSSALLNAVLDTTLDAAFVTQSNGPPGLTLHRQWDEPSTVTVSPDHPLAHGGAVEIADLAQHPVALHSWGDSARDIPAALGEQCPLTIVSPAAAAVALAQQARHVAITLALATENEVNSGQLVQLQVRDLTLASTTVSIASRKTDANDTLITQLKHLAAIRTSSMQPEPGP